MKIGFKCDKWFLTFESVAATVLLAGTARKRWSILPHLHVRISGWSPMPAFKYLHVCIVPLNAL